MALKTGSLPDKKSFLSSPVIIISDICLSQAKKEWRVVSDFLRKIAQTETKRCNLDSLVEINIGNYYYLHLICRNLYVHFKYT